MVHEMKLNDKAFNNIKNGIKKFELRLYDDRRKNINLGDTIIFHNLNNLDDTISVNVLALFKLQIGISTSLNKGNIICFNVTVYKE